MNNNWWDGRNPDSFFPGVYRLGDNSIEGYLEGQHLDLKKRTIRECDMIESILNLADGAKILDTPCGYGRHTLELARRGYDVTGVDLCQDFLDVARNNAPNLPPDNACSFIHGDMRNLPQSLKDFDACINMFLSFGFFDDRDNIEVLKEFYRVLHPGGKLLIHTDVNPDRLKIGGHIDRPVRNLKSGGRLSIDESFDPQTGTLNGSWTIDLDTGRQISRSYSIRIYNHDEMIEMLKKVGFSEITTIFPDDLPQNPDKPCQETVYVATR